MRRYAKRTPWFTAALLALAFAPHAWSEVLYRSAQTLAERVGRVEVRSSFGVRLPVTLPCESGQGDCYQEQVYDEVLKVDFFSVLQEVDGDAVVTTEEPVGTVLLATHFDNADRTAFREILTNTFLGLPADAFDEPFAGLEPTHAPFDSKTMGARSILPSWVCFEQGGQRSMTLRFLRQMVEDRVVGTGATRYRHPPTALCDEIATATESQYPDVYRTLVSPSRLLERVVEHVDVVALNSDPRALPERPYGVGLVKQEQIGTGTIEASSRAEDDGLSRGTRTDRGWRYDAWAEPASISNSTLYENAWLHALRVTTIQREFGPHPSERVVDRSVLLTAYLATLPAARFHDLSPDGSIPLLESGHPAVEFDPPRGTVPPRVDRTAFIDRLVAELDGNGGVLDDRIRSWLEHPEVGLESEGWLVVVCSGDGSAFYRVPPTRAGHRVTNGREFCSTLESLLN